MEIMYISRRFKENICATIHYQVINEIFGEDNVYTVDLRMNSFKKTKNYISYGQCSKLEKIKRFMELNDILLSDKIINDICGIINKQDITQVFIDESGFGKLVREIKTKCSSVKVVSFYHDIDRVTYKQRLKINGIKFLPTYITTIYGEYLTQKYSDYNVVLNHRDALELFRCYGKKTEVYLPMSVDEPELELTQTREYIFNKGDNIRYILFVGAYYYPNLNGLKWFIENVFISLNNNYKLLVVGRGMEKIREQYLYDNRIEIIGSVDSLAPYYNNSDIVIAPLFEGGGMKQKTAEAFAYGKCFIGTTESLIGYEEAIDIEQDNQKSVFCCDLPEEQLAAFRELELYDNYHFQTQLYNLYKNKYSKDVTKKILTDLLKK